MSLNAVSRVWVVVACLAWVSIAQAGSKWEHVKTEEGVKISQRLVEGRDLPMFRGETIINANIYDLLAVISDITRHKEWMHGCYEAKRLKQLNDTHLVSYNRTDSPWPVDDRDVVLDVRISIMAEKHTVRIDFKGITSPLKTEVEGVVRMKRLKGYYQLRALSDKRTAVMYQVDADPGGAIPAWVAEMVVDDMPVNTLNNLRKQVGKVRGQYKSFHSKWNPTQNPDAPQVIP